MLALVHLFSDALTEPESFGFLLGVLSDWPFISLVAPLEAAEAIW